MSSGFLQLMIDTHPTYENGDVLSAANHLQIRRSASSRICFARGASRQFAGLNSDGFLPHSHVLKDWNEACREYRLERLNRNQAKMTRIRDSEELVITSGVPHTDVRGVPDRVMDVGLYFSRQLSTFQKQNAQGNAMFSDDGDEQKVVMYGGGCDQTAAKMDTVWTAIEAKTDKLESNETTYAKEPPFGSYQRRRIILRVDDFTDSERSNLQEPILDLTNPDHPLIIKKRKSWVDWENDLGLTAKEIDDSRDDREDPDLRSDERTRSTIVKTKTV